MLRPCIPCQRREIGVVHVRQSAAATVFRPVGLCENVLVRQRADWNFARAFVVMLTKELVKQSPWPFFIVMDGPGPATSRHWAEMAGSLPGSGLATAMTMKKARLLKRNITGQS